MSAQLAAASFLKLFRDGQVPTHRSKARTTTRTDNLPNWQQEAAQHGHEQLYDPFEQHCGARSQTVSFDGFEPLHMGAHSGEVPARPRAWRFA